MKTQTFEKEINASRTLLSGSWSMTVSLADQYLLQILKNQIAIMEKLEEEN